MDGTISDGFSRLSRDAQTPGEVAGASVGRGSPPPCERLSALSVCLSARMHKINELCACALCTSTGPVYILQM